MVAKRLIVPCALLMAALVLCSTSVHGSECPSIETVGGDLLLNNNCTNSTVLIGTSAGNVDLQVVLSDVAENKHGLESLASALADEEASRVVADNVMSTLTTSLSDAVTSHDGLVTELNTKINQQQAIIDSQQTTIDSHVSPLVFVPLVFDCSFAVPRCNPVIHPCHCNISANWYSGINLKGSQLRNGQSSVEGWCLYSQECSHLSTFIEPISL
eukprot:m.40662 g.40662  ORF g.40662 m.40662 type:complete len:214 (-) comp10452_c0_seq2:1627-2268(-)